MMSSLDTMITDAIQNSERFSQQPATAPPKPTPPITINNGQAKAPAPVAHKSSSGGGTSISSLYESDMNEQAHELKNFIFDIINKGKLTPEDVKKESADMESRMQLHYLSMVSS